MSSRRLSCTEKRRARRNRLAMKVDRLDRLETRNTITEPISILGLSLSAFQGLARIGLMDPNAMRGIAPPVQATNQAGHPAGAAPTNFIPIVIGLPTHHPATAGGGGASDQDGTAQSPQTTVQGGSDWLTFLPVSNSDSSESGISTPWHPIARAGGGAALPPRGGSGGPGAAKATARGAINPIVLPASTPGASNAGGSGALLAAVAGASGNNGAAAPAALGSSAPVATTPSGRAPAGSAHSSGNGHAAAPLTASGGGPAPGSTPDPVIGNASGPSQQTFTYFPMYVLDNNNGVVLFPGVDQHATLGGYVDLEAQVSGTTVTAYNWNTSGLGSDATHLSATNTYQLTFQWLTYNPAASHTDPVTLSVTDSNSHIETYTYDFQVPSGDVNISSGGSNATWPQALPPDQQLLSSPAFTSDNASVDATSGALDTEVDLPGYNPNVPALALTYDSITANTMPIIVVENTLSASAAVPSQVSAQLTFNGTALTTYYYNTSQFNPGDVQQIALQATNATSLSTGRYSYSVQVVDIGTTNTTITLSGTATVLSQTGSAFGDGWTLQGLEQITSASGGVILNLGDGGRSLWFSGGSGSGGTTYTDPQGEFSTLVKNSGGSYTDTLTDGTQVTFNSGGYETAVIDRNNNHITYSYNGSNQLTSITDSYSNVTTFSYSGGYLQTITDPASRNTTFTHSGASLTGATLPDGSTWGYGYDSGGRLTHITDPRSNTVTVSYDSAERAGTVTRPDLTTEEFTPDQESGWTNTGTSGSPAAATLLAQATSTYTDPNGNTTSLRPDWWGMGLTGVRVDALGNVATYDRNSNGLATVAIDQVNRIDLFTYDTKGNMTGEVYPDGNNIQYTYNSDAEPLSYTNADGNSYNYTYDGNGNLTVVKDPLTNLTTMTYTTDGMLKTVTDANNHVVTYQYDSQDRVTTVINADGTTVETAYNSQGNVIKVTDERGNATTYSFDAMNRRTGMTDALNDITTSVYDSGGNLTVDQEPTPAGQTARTTTYAYDSLDRLTTITAPLSQVTVYGYDAAGNRITVSDPLQRVTTTIYDVLNRPVVTIDPMSNRTSVTYDGDGEVIQVVDPIGRITTTTFDNRGWVATVTDPLGNITTYSYTATGKTSTETDPGTSGGSAESYFYDKDDRLIAVTDPNNHTTSYGYDAVGNEVSVTDANSNITTYVYDARNRVTTITDALGHNTVIGFDSGGNQQTVTDALGHTTTTLYDALNRATTMISAVSGTTTITFDAGGRETSLTDPVGNKTQWAYDALDRTTTMTLPNGSTVTYVYDAGNELTDTTDADGRRTTYSYDADGDQTGETWVGASPSEKITYTYDADNELTGAADAYATLTFTYDSGGNEITAATSGPGTGQPSVTLTSGYNAQHSLTSVTDNLSSQGITTYVYDAGQRLTTITTSYAGTAGPQVVTSYDPANRITAESRTIGGSGTAVATSLSYDAANRQTTITDQVTGGSALATIVYTYDNANRVTSEKDAEGTASFTYDNANELTAVTGSRTESYSYDLNGNRTGTGYSTTVMNETATSPGVTYTYDNAGNMISANNGTTITTYTYDYHNRLTEVTTGGTVVATYTYNALDQRIGVKDSGTQTWTVFNGKSADADPYADFNGSGTLTERYLFGPGVVNGAAVDEILARTSSGGTTAWYLTDKLSSVRDIVSTSGSELDHIVYDSFGNIVTETNAANGDRFKFAGMQYDATTGQYFDHARWYGSGVGRFLRQDPKGFAAGDSNLYRYANNGPTDGTDRSGLELAMPSGSDYFHFLTNPSTMDTDLRYGFYGSLGVAGVSLSLAVGMLALGVGGAEAAGALMAEEGIGAVAEGEAVMLGESAAMGEGAMAAGVEEAAALEAEEAVAVETEALTSNQLGRLGENFVGTTQQKIKIAINGRIRIPDLLDRSAKLMQEVKNVTKLAYTRQLRDFVDFAQQNGLQFQLFVC